MSTLDIKMTALADAIRELSGTSTSKGVEVMAEDISRANSEIIRQAELIAQILAALESNEPAEVLEGDGQEFYTMAPSTLSFRSTAPLDELQNVMLNGEVLDPSNYELEEGSTIVKLPIEYLKTLDVGNYELAVESTSKTVKGGFTVAAPELNEYGFYYNQPYFIETHYMVNPNFADEFSIPSILFESELASLPEDVLSEFYDHPYYLQHVYGGAIVFLLDGTAKYFEIGGESYDIDITFDSSRINFYLYPLVYSAQVSAEDHTIIIDNIDFASSDLKEVYAEEYGFSPDYLWPGFTSYIDTFRAAADSEYLYILLDDTIQVSCLDQTKSEYSPIKSNINGIPVTCASVGMFSHNLNLINAPKLPDTFVEISANMFSECNNLQSIVIPKGVIALMDNAFYNCTNLTSITIPGTVENIESFVFSGCSSLTAVHIPSSVTYISLSIFSNCSNLISIIVEKGNPRYHSSGNCLIETETKTLISGISNSVIPSDGSVTSIGYGAFMYCTNLTSVIIPDNVTSIGPDVFSGCSNLTAVNFNGTMTQWNAVAKGINWNTYVPATYVQCSDGQVAL